MRGSPYANTRIRSVGASICMCEIGKRGNHPSKTPGGRPPLGRPARPHVRPGGRPSLRHAPSHPLLNFKPRSEEQPGGGGFLRSRAASHGSGPSAPGTRVPSVPDRPAFPPGFPSPSERRRRGRARGRARGGAQAARARAPPHGRPAPRLTPHAPRPGEGGGVEATSATGNPPPARPPASRPGRGWAGRPAPPPAPGLRHPWKGDARKAGAREFRGWEGVSHKSRGGREGGGGEPGGGQGD